jgi:hypothetical protein
MLRFGMLNHDEAVHTSPASHRRLEVRDWKGFRGFRQLLICQDPAKEWDQVEGVPTTLAANTVLQRRVDI